MSEPKHTHQFTTTRTKVLLRAFGHEDGKMKYQSTTGYDWLVQRVCDCGMKETIDIERNRL